MSGIPVTLQLDPHTFNKLERIATDKGTTIRELLVDHIHASLAPVARRVTTRRGKVIDHTTVSTWVDAARMGVTNRAIAERWEVPEREVSRALIEAGIRRQVPKGESVR